MLNPAAGPPYPPPMPAPMPPVAPPPRLDVYLAAMLLWLWLPMAEEPCSPTPGVAFAPRPCGAGSAEDTEPVATRAEEEDMPPAPAPPMLGVAEGRAGRKE